MKGLFVVLALLFHYCMMSQNVEPKIRKINAHYIWSNVGANVSLSYQFKHKKIEPFVGVMYHINLPPNDLRYYGYRHRFYNKNVVDGLGVNFGLTRPFNIKNSNLGFYFLYQGQVSHMHNRFVVSSGAGVEPVYYFTPSQMWIVENNLGVGINVKIYGDLFLNASVAGGVAAYMVKNQYTDHEFFMDWELSDHYRIGISYLIPARKE